MTAPTKAQRPQPPEPCANCKKPGIRWHCPTTNHQCVWIVCASCSRQYQRSRPTRWREWKAPAT